MNGDGALERVGDGLPEWLEGKVDTRCLFASAGRTALVDGSGAVWARPKPEFDTWSLVAEGLPSVRSVVVV